ncbi:outer membrane protein assembly factor BamB family protein [Sphingobacterium hungaricum]
MRNTIIVTILLTIAVVGASIYYFSSINGEQKTVSKPLTYLPETTLLIVATQNDETTDNIFKDFEVFDALIGFKQSEQYDYLQNHLLRNKAINNYVHGAEMYVSFHPIAKEIETLFTIPTIEDISKADFPELLKTLNGDFKLSTQDTLGESIYTIQYGSKDSVVHLAFLKQVFFVSPSKELITQIIDKNIPKLASQQIDFFVANNRRNAPLSVYFPHQQLDTLTDIFKQNNPGDFLKQFAGLDGESAWNINFKQDALMLSGESQLTHKEGNYIALFSSQAKTAQRLYTYFPSNTAFYMEYSLASKNLFQDELGKLFTYRKESTLLNATDGKQVSKTAQDLQKALGKEFALVELTNRSYLGYVSVENNSVWEQFVNQGTESLGDSIYRFRESNLLYAYYGDALKPFTRPYLYKTDDVVIVSNELSTLRDYIQNWKSKDLLIGTLGFKNFERLVGNEANVTYFAHAKNASSTISNQLTSAFSKNFRDKENYGYQDFYAWSAQLSGNNGAFLSRVYAVYKSKNTLGSNPAWKYTFNNRLITQPYVFEHSDTSQFILVQEQDHTVHAISPSGTKIWSSVFSGRIVGDVIQLSDRSLVLVTDRNRLYRFDPDGKMHSGFSKDIGKEPSSSVTLGQIAGEEILFIPVKNQILAYHLDGQAVENWTEETVDGEIIGDVKQVNGQLVVGTTYGRVYVFDQQGRKQKEFDAEGNVVFRNPIGIANASTDSYSIYATDTSSRIYQFNTAKPTVVKQLEKWSSKHYADFVNIQSSSNPEMIILDQAQLRVYELADSIRLSYTYSFTKEIDNKPQFFKADGGLYKLGIASRSTNLIYLFTESGAVEEGFPVEALPLFYYGKINYNSGNYLLCSRRDHTLYAYPH